MSTLAILGVGRWGRNYIKAIEKIPGIHLKYLCATKKESLAEFSNNYIKVYDYKDLSKFKDIDGIIIATSSSTHYKITKYFMDKGFNLLIEKPLATNYRDAEDLIKIYNNSKTTAMVGHIFLYNTAYLKFKKFISKIGNIKYLDFEGCDFGPFPKDSSVLWEWAPHDVSMCLDLLSKLPISVSAYMVGEGMVYARLKFKDKVAFMKFGWLSPVKKRQVTIVGSEGSIIFDDTKDKKVSFYKKTGIDSVQYPDYLKEEPLMFELKEFVNCIQEKKVPKTDIKSSALVIKVIDCLQKSMNNNGKIIYI